MPKKIEQLWEEMSVVDPQAIVTIDKTKRLLYIGGELADPGRLANLKAEADFLVQTDLWKLIHETPKQLAHREMFVAGDSLDAMKKGRSMLFWVDAQKNIIDTLRSYTPKTPQGIINP